MLIGGIPPIPSALFIRQACYRAAAISPDGRTIVTTTRGPSHNVMAVIDRAKNKVIDKWTADSSVCDLQFSPIGKLLVAATSKGVILIDTMTWKKTGRF
jgi:WD40 repeat protein